MNKDNNIPQSILGIIRWFCPEQLLEGIEGDLVEQYQNDLSQGSRSRAMRRLIWNIIRLFHPEIVLRNKFKTSIIQTMMVRNYIKVSLRNIQKRKLYSLINTIGLAIGMAFCLLIFLFVKDENSFDQFHVNKDRIYRIEVKSYDYWNEDGNPEQKFSLHPYNQMALGVALKEEASAVEYVTRFGSGFSAGVQFQDKLYKEEVTYVDADFFRIFSFELVAGSLNKVFDNNNSLVLTQSMAKKYFNEQNPIGQIIDVDQGGTRQYTVAAVLRDPPSQSSIDFDFLLPYQNWGSYERQMARWGNFNTPTIIQLEKNATVENLRENMNAIK
ncbi:MAG: ABC transporter permease, partial [Cyclobacteriaceae bacterium]